MVTPRRNPPDAPATSRPSPPVAGWPEAGSQVGALRVWGGAAGVAAHVEDLHTRARLLAEIVLRLEDIIRVLRFATWTSALRDTAACSPATAARASTAGAAAIDGATANTTTLAHHGAQLRRVATTVERSDRWRTRTQRLNSSASGLLAASAGLSRSLTTTPRRGVHAVGTALLGAGILGVLHGPVASSRALQRLPGAGVAALRGELSDQWTARLIDRPSVTDGLVDGVAALHTLASLLARTVAPPVLEVGGYEGTVAALLAWARSLGLVDDHPLQLDEPASREWERLEPGLRLRALFATRVPASIEDLAANQASLQTLALQDPATSRIRIIEVPGPERSAWIVQVPGTQHLRSTTNPADLPANLPLIARRDAGLLDGVQQALHRHGVGDDPILIAGHSQGGLVATSFARQASARGFNVTHAVTFGAPVARSEVPDHVQLLAIEHHHDPVPRLDGRDNPPAANVTTVRALGLATMAPADLTDTHGTRAYRATAVEVDRSRHPSVRAFLRSADAFFAQTPTFGTTALRSGRLTDHTITRTGR